MTRRIPTRTMLPPRDRERLLSKAKDRIRARAESPDRRAANERRLAALRARLATYEALFAKRG